MFGSTDKSLGQQGENKRRRGTKGNLQKRGKCLDNYVDRQMVIERRNRQQYQNRLYGSILDFVETVMNREDTSVLQNPQRQHRRQESSSAPSNSYANDCRKNKKSKRGGKGDSGKK